MAVQNVFVQTSKIVQNQDLAFVVVIINHIEMNVISELMPANENEPFMLPVWAYVVSTDVLFLVQGKDPQNNEFISLKFDISYSFH